jgi:hypothetical protein
MSLKPNWAERRGLRAAAAAALVVGFGAGFDFVFETFEFVDQN